jgi:hypothetical protein
MRRNSVAALTFALIFCANLHTASAQMQHANTQSPPLPDSATEPTGFLPEPLLVERAVLFLDRNFAGGDLNNGIYADMWNMVPGAGWLAGGPGYRHWYNHDRVFIDGSAAVSWHGYKVTQGRVELPKLARSRVSVGSQVWWQDLTHVEFFGEGPGSLESTRSAYRIKSTNVVGYATLRPFEWLGIGTQVGWLEPEILSPHAALKGDEPDVRLLFPDNIVFRVDDQPSFVHSEASITADTRDFPGHPLRGGVYRAAMMRYSDRDTGVFSFRRYEAEAAHFLPMAGSRIVLALHGWLVGSDTDAGEVVPFYLQPSLGGQKSLRAYPDYRFHDRQMLVATAEIRIAAMTHVDAAVFADAGNVAADRADLNLDKRAYGFGLRLHSRRQTFGRIDVAHGDEGWRIFFNLRDPLNLSRLRRRTATAPFVP